MAAAAAETAGFDSVMEFDFPGEEKKKRWEAKTAAKSGGGEWSESTS